MSNSEGKPTHGLLELEFLRLWAGTDYSSWNETEVREGFVIQLLHLLGYRKGTRCDIEMEKTFTLSEPYHQIGRRRVKIDYAPSLRLRHFWIVEVKGGEAPLQFKDVLQAHLYAIHPEVQARLIVLCNGFEVRVYDALTVSSFDDALLVVGQNDCLRDWAQLREVLSAQSLLRWQRKHLLSLAKETLDIEVDIRAFDEFAAEAQSMLRDGRKRINRNARDLRTQQLGLWRDGEDSELQKATIEGLLVRMDRPSDGRRIAAEEFVQRILAKQGAERQQLVDLLAMRYRGRPHNIFRVLAVYVLVRLVEEGVEVGKSAYVHGVAHALEGLVRANSSYWLNPSHSGSKALCHLDNVAMRVAYKLCTRVAMDYHVELAREASNNMTPEERVASDLSVADLMIPSIGHAQEMLWRRYCSLNQGGIWAGVWTLQAIESELNGQPEVRYPDGNSDLLFFSLQGLTCDQLCDGTRNVLHEKLASLQAAGIADDVIAFGQLSTKEVKKRIPTEPTAPPGFMSAWSLRGMLEDLLPKVIGLRTIVALFGARLGSDEAGV